MLARAAHMQIAPDVQRFSEQQKSPLQGSPRSRSGVAPVSVVVLHAAEPSTGHEASIRPSLLLNRIFQPRNAGRGGYFFDSALVFGSSTLSDTQVDGGFPS